MRRYLFLCANCHSAHALSKTDTYRYLYGAKLVPECCGRSLMQTGWNAEWPPRYVPQPWKPCFYQGPYVWSGVLYGDKDSPSACHWFVPGTNPDDRYPQP